MLLIEGAVAGIAPSVNGMAGTIRRSCSWGQPCRVSDLSQRVSIATQPCEIAQLRAEESWICGRWRPPQIEPI